MGLILMKKGTCKNISVKQAQQLFNTKNVIVVDVRDKDEYAKQSIKNSINIPVVDIKRDIKKRVKNRRTKIIVYCSSGERSIAACQILADRGYRNVYNIATGINFQ